MAIALRYAARSDVGLVRSNNQDSGFAGPSLLIIADGMGGHAGGDIASSLAIGEMAPLNDMEHGFDAAQDELLESLRHVQRELEGRVAEEPALSGMGTTVTALLRVGNGRLAMAHIGDSRAYVLHNGRLDQITRDHTFVQRLVDDGRITLAEAEQHPQRSVLMRVLSDVMDDVDPDLSMIEAQVGDRYLLCSDGLSGVVSFETLEETLAFGKDPASTCDQLVQLALRSGAPDNVTCIVADVVDSVSSPVSIEPVVVGAASLHPQPRIGFGGSAAERAAELTSTAPIPVVRDYDDRDHPDEQLYENGYSDRYEDQYQQPYPQDDYREEYRDQYDDRYPESARSEEVPPGRPRGGRNAGRENGGRGRGLRLGLFSLLVVLLVAAGGYGAYRWSQGQYFVGAEAGTVAIFKGLPQSVGPVDLKSVASRATDVPLSALSPNSRQRVEDGIPADDQAAAQTTVSQLRDEVNCRVAASQPLPTPTTPTPTGAGTPTTQSPGVAATTPAPSVTSPAPGGGTSTACAEAD